MSGDPSGRRRAAVLGSPIAHSLSPVLHRAGYAATGLDWSYQAIECDAAALPALVGGLDASWAGLSVTMPGKAAAAAVATERSDRVRRLGVANTLLRRTDGWAAENTDVDGVRGALRSAGVPSVDRAVVLGGGGTAMAVVLALAEMGARSLVLVGRRPQSTAGAAALARDLGLDVTVTPFDVDPVAAAARKADLVVSTVPAGGADALAAAVAPAPVLLDVVYAPWPTVLAAAGAADRVVVTGLDMLLHQALRQFELMTGVSAPAAAMRDALRAASGTDLALPVD
ncbi:shikimate dehydrogenase [Nakamurella flavida]|uniref:Shikimate dehydrogenase n=1 Tax=Nakamurella flavida TaxID=363630 RepID=A0A938YMA9_9ACTN|nr:shikimate dehydrogenase [Nakamurella flavida]